MYDDGNGPVEGKFNDIKQRWFKCIPGLERGNWSNYGNGGAGFRSTESSFNVIKGKTEHLHINAGRSGWGLWKFSFKVCIPS